MFTWARTFLARPGVASTLRMSLFSVYGVVIIGQDVADLETQPGRFLWAVDVVLWAALLVDYIVQIRRAEDKRRFLLANLGYPLFLITGALIPFDNPWLVGIPLLVGYALQVRELAAGHALTFSVVLVLFILVISSVSLYIVERDQPETTIASPGDAFAWSLARVFRVYSGNATNPVSSTGQDIAFLIGMAAIVTAGLFSGQVIRWLIHDGEDKASNEEEHGNPTPASAEDIAALRVEVARMSEQVQRLAEIVGRSGGQGDDGVHQ